MNKNIQRFPRLLARTGRNAEGRLLCICGKALQWYSGKYRRGICSEECSDFLDSLGGKSASKS